MDWKTSSFCATGSCLEVAKKYGHVVIRDAAGESVIASKEEWEAFVKGVKAGEFD